MRDYKFRAWDKIDKEMCGVAIISFVKPDPYVIIYGLGVGRGFHKRRNFDEVIFLDYTGLNDKKRTEEFPEGQGIYEGDYIKDERGFVYLVYWDDKECAFKLDYKYYHHRDKDECHTYLPMYSRSGEVIGNIYENPELLEVTP